MAECRYCGEELSMNVLSIHEKWCKVQKEEEVQSPDSISKMKADAAIDLIEQCIEIERITTWLEEEFQNKKRTTVLKALDEKMAELEDKDNKENDGSEGEK